MSKKADEDKRRTRASIMIMHNKPKIKHEHSRCLLQHYLNRLTPAISQIHFVRSGIRAGALTKKNDNSVCMQLFRITNKNKFQLL